MLRVYLTTDTEYSAGMYRRGETSEAANFDHSIRGLTPSGEVGIFYQMDFLERHGLKGVFFVDPMPALVWGERAISRIVEPILSRGHDVQLHLHTEWLAFGAGTPIGKRTGQHLKDFSREEQRALLAFARDTLVAAGAPPPVAFRAGNYGANDDTLRALADLGIGYDTSFCPGIAGSACAISLDPNCLAPTEHEGVVEVPVGAISAGGPHRRHAQLTALSSWEILSAIRHAAERGEACFTIVSHSFELMSRDRRRANRLVRRRFERLCAALARQDDVAVATYRDAPPALQAGAMPIPLPHSRLRTAARQGEQLVGNILYGWA